MLRATQGLLSSVPQLLKIELAVPGYTTYYRRQKLTMSLPQQARDEPLHVVVDATGIKAYGKANGKCAAMGIANDARGASYTWVLTRPVARSWRRPPR
jgi:ribosomal protein L37E